MPQIIPYLQLLLLPVYSLQLVLHEHLKSE